MEEIQEEAYGEERVWLRVREDGRWEASLRGKRARPGTARAAPGPGEDMVPGDYESKDAAFEAAKKYIDQRSQP